MCVLAGPITELSLGFEGKGAGQSRVLLKLLPSAISPHESSGPSPASATGSEVRDKSHRDEAELPSSDEPESGCGCACEHSTASNTALILIRRHSPRRGSLTIPRPAVGQTRRRAAHSGAPQPPSAPGESQFPLTISVGQEWPRAGSPGPRRPTALGEGPSHSDLTQARNRHGRGCESQCLP